jgi:hypothetical protein
MSIRFGSQPVDSDMAGTESLLDAGTAGEVNVQYIGGAMSGILPAHAWPMRAAGLASLMRSILSNVKD